MASNSGILEFDERIETGEAVRLTPRPLDALCLLVDRQGEIVSKHELMQRLWPRVVVEESNLTQTIYVLRQALGEGSSKSRYRHRARQRLSVRVPGAEAAADIGP